MNKTRAGRGGGRTCVPPKGFGLAYVRFPWLRNQGNAPRTLVQKGSGRKKRNGAANRAVADAAP